MDYSKPLIFTVLSLLAVVFITACTRSDTTKISVEFAAEFSPSELLVRGPETRTRRNICLNGQWEFQPIYAPYDFEKTKVYGLDAPDLAPDLPPPAAGQWENTRIKIPSPWNQTAYFPTYPEKWEDAEMGWLRRPFEVPSDWEGHRIILYFEAVSGDSRVLLNGKEIGTNFDSTLPFEFDITDEVKKGQANELMVGIRAHNLFVEEATYGKRPYPPGGSRRLIGIWQDVHLVALPEVYVSNVFVRPEVSKQLLVAEVNIRNTTGSPQELTVGAVVSEWINLAGKDSLSAPEVKWKLGAKSLELGQKEITVPPKSDLTVQLRAKVNGELNYWDIGQPNLYGMVTSLTRKGEVADIKYERFGWREFNIDGDQFFINGKPVQLFGDSQHQRNVACLSRRFAWAWFNLIKEAGGNAARLHALVFPRYFHDMADEMGIVILPESSIYASQCDLNYESELFWRAAKYNIEGMVKKYRNHACVFGWSIENEVLPALNVKCDDPDFKQMVYDGMGELAGICRKFDPTRNWISGDGSGDMDGRLPVYLVHYGSTASYKEDAAGTDKPFGVGEACIAYYSTPRQSEMYLGDRAYRSYEDHQDAIAIDAYELIKTQREVGIYCSIWNLGYYSVEKLPLGLPGSSPEPGRKGGVYFTAEYEEGEPGMQPEFLPAYATQYNPGYDPALPMYIKRPLFHAVKAAFHRPEPLPCGWDHRQIYKSPPPSKIDSPAGEILFIGPQDSDAYFNLKNAGLPLTIDASDPEFLLVDCNSKVLIEEAASKLEIALQNDATVIFWGLTPENLENVAAILPFPVEIFERKATSLIKNEKDIRVASIPYKDLYFAENTDSEVIMKYGLGGEFVRNGNVLLRAHPVDWSTKDFREKPKDPTLVEVKAEQGTYILSTLNIEVLTPAHVRILAQLFRNLGVEVRPVEVKRGSVFNQTSQLTKALIAGCYQAPSLREAFEQDFIGGDTLQPELGMVSNGCIWEVAETKTGLFDLKTVRSENEGGGFMIKYLSFWLHSPKPMDEILADPDVPQVHLEFSTSNGISIRLNGQDKFSFSEPPETGTLKNLPLKKGWNHFLVKLIGTSGDLTFKGQLISRDLDLLSSMRSALNPYAEKANFSVVQHTDPEITYDQHWGLQGDGWYESFTPGARASFKFYGTGITMTGLVFPKGGKAKLFIDGKFDEVIDYYREERDPHGVIYTKSGLPNGEHEVILEVIAGWVALGPFEQWESY